jgi:nuclear receptor interaction protein
LNSYGADYHTKALKLFKIPTQEKRPYRVTSLVYSKDETELLVSFSSEYLYLFDVTKEGVEVEGSLVKGRRRRRESPRVLRKLRLRGDWSDTGPEARPISEVSAQSRPQLNSGLMNRMTGLLSRMLNDPRQRQNRNDENIAEGISILFGNNEEEVLTSAAGSSSNESDETQNVTESSNSSSEDDSLNNQPNYDYSIKKYLGHRNCRTMIKEANYWGDDFVSLKRTCVEMKVLMKNFLVSDHEWQ